MGCCASVQIAPAVQICLPSQDGDSGGRRRLLEEARSTYEYTHPKSGLPPFIKNMPEDEKFPPERDVDFADALINGRVNQLAHQFISIFDPLNHMSDFDDFFITVEKPLSGNRWVADREFGAQRLRGVLPQLIRKIVDGVLPQGCVVTDADVQKVLPKETIASLSASHRLFICDYAIIEGIPTKPGTHAACPYALFYLHGGELLPLAIQLERGSGPVFTPPNDPMLRNFGDNVVGMSPEGLTWLFVRMFVQNADAQVHQFMYHFCYTHLVGEVTWIAIKRTLSERHPIYVVMEPHFIYNLAINDKARSTLINKGGAIDQMFAAGYEGAAVVAARAWAEFDWNNRLFLNDLEVRGVTEKDIPDYPWRDDCLIVHAALTKFVNDIVGQVYRTDADVVADVELQAFFEEMRNPKAGGVKGFPAQVKTIAEAAAIIGQCMWIGSVGHASLNFPQWEYMVYVPNYPLKIMGECPTKPDTIKSEEDLCKLLPNQSDCAKQVIFGKVLTLKSSSELGNYEEDTHQRYPAVFGRHLTSFRAALKACDTTIEERNKTREVKYEYCLRENVPNSTAI